MTFMLMGGIVAPANTRLELQVANADTYIVLHAAYLLVAALSAELH